MKLTREQHKLIAIVSMVIDHVAWGFVEFYSPLGQILHVMGRLTIPIMCFFIAEGFRKTSNLKNYINRMISFGIITILPFYIFFSEEYGYRTNIIFDLLFGLLALTVLESKLEKWAKVGLMILIFATSAAIGGWPILPTLFILIFYYGKDFKQKAILFIIADVTTVLFLAVAIYLNSIYHFSHYEWVWWDKSYQLGFMLALPLLYCYNGQKGKPFLSKRFFYIFYPAHFIVLAAIKAVVVYHASAYAIDMALHIGVLAVLGFLIFQTMRCRSSRGQVGILLFLTSGAVYVFGFVLEIISSSQETYHLAILVEYFGEMMCFIGLLYFVHVLCRVKAPIFVYLIQIVISMLIMYGILTTLDNRFFYENIEVDFSGPFPRLELTYGTGFSLAISYIAILSIYVIFLALYRYKQGNLIDKKRLKLFMLGVLCVWLPYPLKILGLTGGYEVPGVGIAIGGICFYMIMIRYGFLSSVKLASESALDHGSDGIVVLGTDYMIEYHNKQFEDIFGHISQDTDLRQHPVLSNIVSGECKSLTVGERIYDFQLETLKDNGYEQGFMLWIHDSTEHYEAINRMQEIATKDALTKLYNRNYFREKVEACLNEGRGGAFLMMDMDNFKRVNDQYGHQVGDDVLKTLANIFLSFDKSKFIGCRLGGDEYAAFLPGNIDKASIEIQIKAIMQGFQEALKQQGYENYTSISVGCVICNQAAKDFSVIYKKTDDALYEIKRNGKNQFVIKDKL